MLECDINKVAFQLYGNHTSALVLYLSLRHIFRAPFPKNTSGQLLLFILSLILNCLDKHSFLRCQFNKVFWISDMDQ